MYSYQNYARPFAFFSVQRRKIFCSLGRLLEILLYSSSMAPLATFSTFSAPSLIFPPPSLSFSPRSLSIGMRVKTNSRFNLKLSVHRKNQEEIVVIDEDNLTDEAIFVFDTCLDWADTRKWKLGDTARAMARWFMRKDRIKLRELMEMTEQEFVEAILKRFR